MKRETVRLLAIVVNGKCIDMLTFVGIILNSFRIEILILPFEAENVNVFIWTFQNPFQLPEWKMMLFFPTFRLRQTNT